MADEMIPDDVRNFILENIDSIAQLEGLLLLRANPEMKWSAETIAKRLYVGQSEANDFLVQLSARGLLAHSGDKTVLYQYQPKSPELNNIVQNTASAYSRYLVPVTSLIHSKMKNRIQGFADAFRIRKDDQ